MLIARFEKRIGGWLIDKILSLGVFGGILCLEILYLNKDFSLFLEILIALALAYLFYVLVITLYLFLSNGYTLGMQIFGIRTYHPTRVRLAFKEAFLKALMTGFLGMDLVNAAYMLFAHTERSVFDRLTNTLVVDVRAEK